MVAKGGDRLLDRDAVGALIARLLPLTDILTPNLPEAARLLEAADRDGRSGRACRSPSVTTPADRPGHRG